MITEMQHVEAELWTLDRMYAKRGIDIGSWSTFDVMQFASAYAHYKLYNFIYKGGDVKQLLPVVRLASLTKAQLLELLPGEKKNQSRLSLYKKARKQLEGVGL